MNNETNEQAKELIRAMSEAAAPKMTTEQRAKIVAAMSLQQAAEWLVDGNDAAQISLLKSPFNPEVAIMVSKNRTAIFPDRPDFTPVSVLIATVDNKLDLDDENVEEAELWNSMKAVASLYIEEGTTFVNTAIVSEDLGEDFSNAFRDELLAISGKAAVSSAGGTVH